MRVGRLCWPHRCGTPAWVPQLLRREACPPRIGSEAGRLLREEILSGATLDIHAADQVLIYLALAGGSSRFFARSLSSHIATTIWLLEQFLPIRFGVKEAGLLVRIKMEPNMTRT